MFTRLPIRILAPAMLAAPVLIIGLLLSLNWNLQAREAVTQLAQENIEQVHAKTASRVDGMLSGPTQVGAMNASLILAGDLDPDSLADWRDTFFNQLRAFDNLSSVTWGDNRGQATWVARYADGSTRWCISSDTSTDTMLEYWHEPELGFPTEPRDSFDYDLYERPWFVESKTNGSPAWSSPYVWAEGDSNTRPTIGVAFGLPLYKPSGDLLGVISTEISFRDFSNFLSSMEIGKTGVAIVLDNDARLIASSIDHPIVDKQGKLVPAMSSSDEQIRAVTQVVQSNSTEPGTHIEAVIDGEKYLVHWSRLDTQPGINWTLITMVPEQDFIASVQNQFRLSTLISVFAVVLVAVAGLFASRWMVAPLLKIVTAVRRIGQGDLDTVLSIRHAPEYNNLADEINGMSLDLKDRLRMRDSLSLAMEVQRNLLPDGAPAIERIDIAGHSTYCDETGGDYYDYLDIVDSDENAPVIAVGDVTGHGIAAALLMATARGLIRSRCTNPGSLADLLNHVNTLLEADTHEGRFMTMLLLTIDQTDRALRWASAGHGPPIVYDPATDTFPSFSGGGIPLGIMEDALYEEYKESNLGRGSVILAATDGVWEMANESGEFFGMDRVHRLLRANADKTAEEISQTIREKLTEFRGKADQQDDLTFVVLKVDLA